MTAYAGVSIRSFLAAGVAVAAVSAVALTPVTPAAPVALKVASPAVHLSAAVADVVADPQVTAEVTGAGDPIINLYNAVQPWIAWGWSLVDWGMSLVPGLWWIAPGVDLVYWTIQPLAEAGVYSFAYLLNGQTDLIGPTIQQAIQQAGNNFVQGLVNWAYSIVPFPPLPPFPIFPTAAVNTAAAVARSASVRPGAAVEAAVTAPEAAEVTAPEAAEVAAPEATETPAAELPASAAPAVSPRVKVRAARSGVRQPAPAAAVAPAAIAPAVEVTAPAEAQAPAPESHGAARADRSDHSAQHQGGRKRSQQ